MLLNSRIACSPIGTRHDGHMTSVPASIASSSELHCPSLSLVLRTIAASLMASCSCARGNAPTYRTRARAVAGAAASAASVASTVCAYLASSTGPTMRREMRGSLACHWVIALAAQSTSISQDNAKS